MRRLFMDSHRLDLKTGLHEFNDHELKEIRQDAKSNLLDSLKKRNNTEGYFIELLIQINKELENRAAAS